MLLGIVHKVVESWIKLARLSNMDLIELLIEEVILRVFLQVCLEVVSVLLLLFCEVSKEVCVISDPSLFLPVKHSALSSLMVGWISHGPGIKLLNFVENAIEFHDGLLNLVPSLIQISAQWDLCLVSQVLELLVDEVVGELEGVQLLVGLLHFLHLVGWIDQDTVSLIVVHMDVDIGCRQSLERVHWTVAEDVVQVDLQVLFSYFEVHNTREHGGVVIIEIRGLVLEAHNLEALAADVTPVHRAFSNEVVHLLVGMRVVLDGGTHADHDTPRGVRGEDEDGVVDGSELGVHS